MRECKLVFARDGKKKSIRGYYDSETKVFRGLLKDGGLGKPKNIEPGHIKVKCWRGKWGYLA